jgi:hypothetical protein
VFEICPSCAQSGHPEIAMLRTILITPPLAILTSLLVASVFVRVVPFLLYFGQLAIYAQSR